MAARTIPAAAPQAAGGPPPGLPVTLGATAANPGHALTQLAQAGDNVIVAGTISGHHRKRAMHGLVGGYCATHQACAAVIMPGRRSRRVGG